MLFLLLYSFIENKLMFSILLVLFHTVLFIGIQTTCVLLEEHKENEKISRQDDIKIVYSTKCNSQM